MDVVVTVVTASSADAFRSSRRGEARASSRSTTIGSSGSRSRSSCERNPRQHDRAVRVELTAFSKGPVIRAEAAADDKMGALDLALDKMASQMRTAADRRRVHHGRARAGLGRPGAGRACRPSTRTAERRRRPVVERTVGPIDGHRRRSAGGAREDPPGHPDDARPGALRDGAGRPRLLPVRRQGERAALGGLPPPRLRLRRDLAGPAAERRRLHLGRTVRADRVACRPVRHCPDVP